MTLGIVAEIDKLFEQEADAKAAGLGAAERLELRRQKAEPIVAGLKSRIAFITHVTALGTKGSNTAEWSKGKDYYLSPRYLDKRR